MEIKGTLGKLYAKADRIDLGKEIARLNKIDLSDTAITLLMNDTTTNKDTTSTAVNWKLMLDQIDLDRVAFAMQMPGDSLRLSTYIDKAGLTDGIVDLGSARYSASQFLLSGSSLSYDGSYSDPAPGFDPAHIALNDVNIRIDSLLYGGRDISARIKKFSANDRSGLTLSSLTGDISSDSTTIQGPGLLLKTPYSEIRLLATVPWNTFDNTPSGTLHSLLTASVGKEDVFIFAGPLPKEFKQTYPQKEISLTAGIEGNLAALRLRQLKGELPGIFNLNITGEMRAVADSIRRSGKFQLDAQTGNLDFVLSMLPESERSRYNLPVMKLKGEATLQNQEYRADLLLTQGEGKVGLTARYNPVQASYLANLKIDSLKPTDFLPKDSLYGLSLTASAKGVGTDFFSRHTRMQADMTLESLQYGQLYLSDIKLDAGLQKGNGHVALDSHNPLLDMRSRIDALLSRHNTDLTFSMDMRSIDLYALRLTDKPFKAGMCLHMDGSTNLKNAHTVHGTVSDISLIMQDSVFRPKDLAMNVLALPDTTYADISAGDFKLHLDGRDGYETLMKKSEEFMAVTDQQLQRRHLNQDSLKIFLPRMTLNMVSGKNNPGYGLLSQRIEAEPECRPRNRPERRRPYLHDECRRHLTGYYTDAHLSGYDRRKNGRTGAKRPQEQTIRIRVPAECLSALHRSGNQFDLSGRQA